MLPKLAFNAETSNCKQLGNKLFEATLSRVDQFVRCSSLQRWSRNTRGTNFPMTTGRSAVTLSCHVLNMWALEGRLFIISCGHIHSALHWQQGCPATRKVQKFLCSKEGAAAIIMKGNNGVAAPTHLRYHLLFSPLPFYNQSFSFSAASTLLAVR